MASVHVIQANSPLSPTELKSENGLQRQQERALKVGARLDSKMEFDQSGSPQKLIFTQSPQVDQTELENLIERINLQLEKLNNFLRFEKDVATEKMVMIIRDRETDEVIRQIPSQEFLLVSKNIKDYLDAQKQVQSALSIPPGLITDEKV